MKFKDLFKRRNTFTVGQFCRVWVYALTTEATLYVEITRTDGDDVYFRYLDREKMEWLKRTDPSFIFPHSVHFKDCRHVAYDEMERCFKLLNTK